MKKSMIFKSILFLSVLLLCVQCQKEEPDLNVENNTTSTEQPTQKKDLSVRAREIVHSEEYRGFVKQSESFFNKIQDENFFTLELFDFDNETYNYDLIRKRLSGTSFKSAEEFVQEYEKMICLGAELGNTHTDLVDPSMQEAMMSVDIEEKENLFGQGMINQCLSDYNFCKKGAEKNYAIALAGCVAIGVTIIPFAGIICIVTVYRQYHSNRHQCEQAYYRCRDRE